MTLRSRVDELSNEYSQRTFMEMRNIIKEYQQLLDRAIMGLEYYAERVDDPHYDVAKRTLADIRKQLDGGGV
jgi:hypothetical protein